MTTLNTGRAALLPAQAALPPCTGAQHDFDALLVLLTKWRPDFGSAQRKQAGHAMRGFLRSGLFKLDREQNVASKRACLATLHTIYAVYGGALGQASPKAFDKLVTELKALETRAMASFSRAYNVKLRHGERTAVDAAVRDIAYKSPSPELRLQAKDLLAAAKNIPVPPVPSGSVRKSRIDAAVVRSLGIDADDIAIREMWDVDGTHLYVSNARRQGGYGKFRIALDDSGQVFGVKEFRSEQAGAKEHMNKHDHRHTHVTMKTDIDKEIEQVKTLSDRLRVHRVMNWHGKYYVVMTLMTGELPDALNALKFPDDHVLGKYALLQMAEAFDVMHKKQVVHGDVKLHNALWDDVGTIAVTDFGFAMPLEADGRVRYHARGTYMAPEVVDKGEWSTTADTWGLGVCILDVYGLGKNPLNFVRGDNGHLSTQLTSERLHAFARWRRRAVNQRGQVELTQLRPDDTFHAYFLPFMQADESLCRFVIERMLDPNPDTRATMPEVIAFVRKHLTPEEEAHAKQLMQGLASEAETAPVVKALRKYRKAHPPAIPAQVMAEAPLWDAPKRSLFGYRH